MDKFFVGVYKFLVVGCDVIDCFFVIIFIFGNINYMDMFVFIVNLGDELEIFVGLVDVEVMV